MSGFIPVCIKERSFWNGCHCIIPGLVRLWRNMRSWSQPGIHSEDLCPKNQKHSRGWKMIQQLRVRTVISSQHPWSGGSQLSVTTAPRKLLGLLGHWTNMCPPPSKENPCTKLNIKKKRWGAGELVQQFWVLAALPENLSLHINGHTAAHNCLWLQSQGIWHSDTDMHAGKTTMTKNKNKFHIK